jgi:hypothetical protein
MGITQQSFSTLLVAALLAGLILACDDQGPGEPPATPGVYVAGVVRDQEGMPVSRIMVVWELWPAPDSVQQGAVSSFSVRWFMRTDSMGRFAAHAGYYGVESLDSVGLDVLGDDCWGLAHVTVRERAVPVNPDVPDTVMNREVTLARTGARARLAVGPACAVMLDPPPFDSENRFALWIDEISDSVRGRWRMNYQDSRGDDYGAFSGWREGSLVTLELRHASPWDAGPPGGICAGYRLELPLEEGDSLGIGTLRSDGCPFEPFPLRFVEGEPLSWPLR